MPCFRFYAVVVRRRSEGARRLTARSGTGSVASESNHGGKRGMKQPSGEAKEYRRARAGLAGGVVAMGAMLATAGWVGPTNDAIPCTAKFTPSSVQISAEPASVRVEMDEVIGEVGNVMAHSDSGIEVGRYNDEMGALTLDVAEANPGEWPITFQGENDATCEGAITVTEES